MPRAGAGTDEPFERGCGLVNKTPVPLIMHVFPSFGVGGAQARFVTIANHYGPAFRHIVVAMDGNLACRECLARDLDAAFPALKLTRGATLSNVRTCRRLLRQYRPDLLVTSNWGSIEWAMANVPPVAPHLHMEDGFGPEEVGRQIMRRVLTRRVVLRRSIILLPSRTLLGIARDIWRLPPENLRYVPNGVEVRLPEAFPFAAAPWPDDVPTIGTVAALRPEKNLPRLLRAFQRLDLRAQLVIVGDGPDRQMLEELSLRLGISPRVQFTGYVNQPQHLYSHFDLFALSSDTEQMPLSVLEAMAAGLPVVSTDVGDVRLMLAEENRCFVVPRREEEQNEARLARCMQVLIRDRRLRQQIGAANRLRALHEYDRETMFRAHWRLWMRR